MPVWKNLIILILYPDPILYLVFCFLMNKIESQIAKFHGMEAAFKFTQFLLLATYLWLCIAIIYMSCYLANWLSCCVYQISNVKYQKLSNIPFLLAFNLKELQIICKPRYLKCFQTIPSNSYLDLASQLLFLFSFCFLQLAQV